MKQNIAVVMEMRIAYEILVVERYDEAPLWGHIRDIKIKIKIGFRQILGVVETLNWNEDAERAFQI